MDAPVRRVSLRPVQRPGAESLRPPARALLAPEGPAACLGSAPAADVLAEPVRPGPATLFGPRGAALVRPEGPLWVCDTGHHRLVGWPRRPERDGEPARWLIGQPDFAHEGRNARCAASSATFDVPTGIAACGAGLAVADAWNHRVLIWREVPQRTQAPADLVLGQADFAGAAANRGTDAPSAASLFWPYGVHWDGVRLWVADTGNRRVLMWQGLPTRSGQAADLVLGQRDFACRDENAGGPPDAASLRWPHALDTWCGRLCVADAGNNRVMVWDRTPAHDHAPCDHVLGQPDEHHVDHNRSHYAPGPDSLNMPYGVAAAGDWLIVADTANSRLLGWHVDDCRTGAPAGALAAQPDFFTKGDNRWQAPQRDSLCWPYGVSVCGEDAVIADSGNNRVLLWRLTSPQARWRSLPPEGAAAGGPAEPDPRRDLDTDRDRCEARSPSGAEER